MDWWMESLDFQFWHSGKLPQEHCFYFSLSPVGLVDSWWEVLPDAPWATILSRSLPVCLCACAASLTLTSLDSKDLQ